MRYSDFSPFLRRRLQSWRACLNCPCSTCSQTSWFLRSAGVDMMGMGVVICCCRGRRELDFVWRRWPKLEEAFISW
jgi:hypothetical protein